MDEYRNPDSMNDYRTGYDDPMAYRKQAGRKGCLMAGVVAVMAVLILGGGLAYFLVNSGDPGNSLSAPARAAAQEFLALAGEGNIADAYGKMSPLYRRQVDEAAFESDLEALAITRFSSIVWTSSRFNFETFKDVELRGTLTTTDGGSFGLTVNLIKEDGDWKIEELLSDRARDVEDKDGPGPRPGATVEADVNEDLLPDAVNPDALDQPLADADSAGAMPSRAELSALAAESILELNRSVVSGDFSTFHDYVSRPLQAEMSADDLKNAFSDFIDKGIDMKSVEGVKPVFDEKPYIDDDGALNLFGHFPTKPAVEFELKYVRDNGAWKVHTINVTRLAVGEEFSPAGRVPSAAQVRELAEQSIMDLDRAAKSEDFTDFYNGVAKSWQDETTPAALQKAFQVFVDRKDLDIGSIKGLVPVFSEDPSIDDNGRLEVKGLYPSKPYNVNFELGYVYEDGQWRLVKISINM